MLKPIPILRLLLAISALAPASLYAANRPAEPRTLIEAALIAGGAQNPNHIRELTKNFNQRAIELEQSLDRDATQADRARAVQAFMHLHFLTGGYVADATDLAKTLENGEFNCVSSSVLYLVLARRCGLNAHAVQLPEHVRCEVLADGIALPIETTAATAGGVASASHTYSRIRTLTDKELLATIVYNRGVVAFDRGDLSEAIALNEQALELDPACDPARLNLLGAINNRVVALTAHREFRAARELLQRGQAIAPDYAPFQANAAVLQSSQ